jgi:hypothetical protein
MRVLGSAIALVLALGAPAYAQDRSITLPAGFTKLLTFSRNFKQVGIGNQAIANVRPAATEDALWLVGKAVGVTNLIVLDDTNREVMSAVVRITPMPEEIGRVVLVKPHEGRGFGATILYCSPTFCMPTTGTLGVKRTAPWPGVPEASAGKAE